MASEGWPYLPQLPYEKLYFVRQACCQRRVRNQGETEIGTRCGCRPSLSWPINGARKELINGLFVILVVFSHGKLLVLWQSVNLRRESCSWLKRRDGCLARPLLVIRPTRWRGRRAPGIPNVYYRRP